VRGGNIGTALTPPAPCEPLSPTHNPSLKLTHNGVRHLAAPGPVGYSPSAAKRPTPLRSA
jgi:hypothetical protein